MQNQPVTLAEVSHVVKAIKTNKPARSEGDKIKYGIRTMCEMLLTLFNLVWDNECSPSYRRKGLIVSLFKKGDREDPGNYRGITLFNVVGNTYGHATPRLLNSCVTGCDELASNQLLDRQ